MKSRIGKYCSSMVIDPRANASFFGPELRGSAILVPTGRLELPRLTPLPPQDSVSTNFTTSAYRSERYSVICSPGPHFRLDSDRCQSLTRWRSALFWHLT